MSAELIQPSAPSRLTREDILAGLPAVVAKVAEGSAERELEGRLPHEIFQFLRTTGLTWLRVPESLGGPGGSLSDQVEITCALAAADSGVARALRGHFGFIETLALDPEGDTSRRFAPEVLAGKLFGGAHMEIGTPRPNMIRTTLRKEGDHYRLSGEKYYATGAIYADYTSFSAVDEEGKPTGVMVPANRDGVEIIAASHTIDTLIAETARRLDESAVAIISGSADVDAVVLAAQLANSKGQVMIGRLALQAAQQLFDTGGGSATSRKRNFDRHWRNVRTLCNHNPASLRGRVLGDFYLNGTRDDFDEGRVF